jgi:hypothetical protein
VLGVATTTTTTPAPTTTQPPSQRVVEKPIVIFNDLQPLISSERSVAVIDYRVSQLEKEVVAVRNELLSVQREQDRLLQALETALSQLNLESKRDNSRPSY